MASRLFTAGSFEAKTLARAGVNLQDMFRRNYNNFIDGEKIADWPYCVECTPFITHDSNRQLRIGRTGLRAMAEMHEKWSPTDQDIYNHAFTVVNYPDADPASDIVIDTTYRQFIWPNLRDNYPLVFVGSRIAAATIMQHAGGDEIFAGLYAPDTLATIGEQDLTQEFDIPVRLQNIA